ncbi:MAG: hypothetical protein HY298_07305 [Verrucomicrobia bacterium]|nr:hypothetical protein [Verrucomicrobiota bacterium]
MPSTSLVVCIHGQRELLQRLLDRSFGCYDDLVVSHDGPDETNVREIVEEFGGRFFEHPRIGSPEGQGPFAWAQAKHDWILRFDADEFPSDEMKTWLNNFRRQAQPPEAISGYTCIWPLWDGTHTVSRKWPAGRIFLLDRRCVKFFGLAEQVPFADGRYEPLDLVLHHQPPRKSYGLHNLLVRREAYRWRTLRAAGLQGKPTDLPTWRWTSEVWPPMWQNLRERPFRSAMVGLIRGTLACLRDQWRSEHRFYPLGAIVGPIHYAMIAFEYWRVRRRRIRAEKKK